MPKQLRKPRGFDAIARTCLWLVVLSILAVSRAEAATDAPRAGGNHHQQDHQHQQERKLLRGTPAPLQRERRRRRREPSASGARSATGGSGSDAGTGEPEPREDAGEGPPADHPQWFVRIEGGGGAANGTAACGGALIARDLVLTTADCADPAAARIGPEAVAVESFARHPGGNGTGPMIVRLERPPSGAAAPVRLNLDTAHPPPNLRFAIGIPGDGAPAAAEPCAVAIGDGGDDRRWFCATGPHPGGAVFERGHGSGDLLLAVTSGPPGDGREDDGLLGGQSVSYHGEWIVAEGCRRSDHPPEGWGCGPPPPEAPGTRRPTPFPVPGAAPSARTPEPTPPPTGSTPPPTGRGAGFVCPVCAAGAVSSPGAIVVVPVLGRKTCGELEGLAARGRIDEGGLCDSVRLVASAVCTCGVPPAPLPTTEPTDGPTTEPTNGPTPLPTTEPTNGPTALPSRAPSSPPTSLPTGAPSALPTPAPTVSPSGAPVSPTPSPTRAPIPMPPTCEAIEEVSESGDRGRMVRVSVGFSFGDGISARSVGWYVSDPGYECFRKGVAPGTYTATTVTDTLELVGGVEYVFVLRLGDGERGGSTPSASYRVRAADGAVLASNLVDGIVYHEERSLFATPRGA